MDASPIPDAGGILIPVISFLFLLLGGAYFAGSETSLSTVNRIRVMTRADDGDKRAGKVLYILDHFDDALSAILVGNNIWYQPLHRGLFQRLILILGILRQKELQKT